MDKDVSIDYGNGMKYCEVYRNNGKLWWQGIWVNDKMYGFWEDYNSDGSKIKDWNGYFFDNVKVSDSNEVGYCLIWDKETT